MVRLTAPRGTAAAGTVIDLVDAHLVAPPRVVPGAVNALSFGADPAGRRESADALDRAIAYARRLDRPLYLPPGTYQVNRHVAVDDVTIAGAGSWYTIVRGREVALDTPAPDGSRHTGVGFYGRDAADGGSSDDAPVRLRDRGRRAGADRHRSGQRHRRGAEPQHHRRPLPAPHEGRHVVRRADDRPAGHEHRDRGPDRRRAEPPHRRHALVGDELGGPQQRRRRAGDVVGGYGERVEHVRVQHGAVAGARQRHRAVRGADLTVAHNLIADPVREGSAIQVGSRFGAEPFTGRLRITGNTTVRAGTYDLNWNIGLGAIWFYALDRSIDAADIQVTGDAYLDSTSTRSCWSATGR
ncbi:glycosyl hydrolase family 28-related protein [Micromonospora sp. BRA006-A]|nr:glycosyl hydrolase family 28-related protein [Micromonospora sp. BRA006-A]